MQYLTWCPVLRYRPANSTRDPETRNGSLALRCVAAPPSVLSKPVVLPHLHLAQRWYTFRHQACLRAGTSPSALKVPDPLHYTVSPTVSPV